MVQCVSCTLSVGLFLQPTKVIQWNNDDGILSMPGLSGVDVPCRPDLLWMYVLCGKALVMIPYGLVAGMDSQFGPFCVAWGGFCALLGGWMLFECRKWFAWTNRQRRKNPTGLEREALDHPFQPSYEKSEDFDGWAGQFLSDQEVHQLHKRHGSGPEY